MAIPQAPDGAGVRCSKSPPLSLPSHVLPSHLCFTVTLLTILGVRTSAVMDSRRIPGYASMIRRCVNQSRPLKA